MISLLLPLCPLLPPPLLLPLHFLSLANLLLVGATEASDRQTGGKPMMNLIKLLFSPKNILMKALLAELMAVMAFVLQIWSQVRM